MNMDNIVETGTVDSSKLTLFNWHLSATCQYSCIYCDSHSLVPKDDVMSYKVVLQRLSKFDGKFEMVLVGGEPTLNENLKEIVKGLLKIENCEYVALVTNLHKSLDYFMEFDRPEYKGRFKIHGSYHQGYAENNNYIEKMLFFKDNIKNIHFSPNFALLTNTPQLEKDIKTLQDNKIKIECHFLRPNEIWDGVQYGDEFNYIYKEYEDIGNFNVQEQSKEEYYFKDKEGIIYRPNMQEVNNNYTLNLAGFRCSVSVFIIGVDNQITRQCSGELCKLQLKADDLQKWQICDRDFCSTGIILNAKKERSE